MKRAGDFSPGGCHPSLAGRGLAAPWPPPQWQQKEKAGDFSPAFLLTAES